MSLISKYLCKCLNLKTIYYSLFVDESKITAQVKRHFQEDGVDKIRVEIRPYQLIKEFLSWLVNQQHDKIWVHLFFQIIVMLIYLFNCVLNSSFY